MSHSFKPVSQLSLSDVLLFLHSRSGAVVEAMIIRHFLGLKRLIIVLGLVATITLVLQVYLATDLLVNSSTTRNVTLAVDVLDGVITTLEAHKQELPQTVVGNRREYFVAPR